MSKVVIAGVRKIQCPDTDDKRDIVETEAIWFFQCLMEYHRKYPITEVISGTADGVDKMGEIWADVMKIPIRRFLPDWAKYGKKAGFIRNEEMVKAADKVIAFWDGFSKGTKITIDLAEKYEKPLTIWRFDFYNP